MEIQEINYFDCSRNAEVTLLLNENDDVIGCEIFYPEPIDFQTFFDPSSLIKTYTSQIKQYSGIPKPPEGVKYDRTGII
jgi:hypothetical protein